MRLKEIKPGMAIHCKNDEERKALLDEAERLGYRWRGGYKISDYKKYNTGHTIHFYGPSSSTNYNYILWSNDTDGVTEFSDLIMPDMTEKEAIEWMAKHLFDEEFKKVFGFDYLREGALSAMTSEEMIERIAEWKDDHSKKEPEIETVDICRIIEIQPDGRKRCVHEEDLASGSTDAEIKIMVEAELKRYCMEHEGEFIAVHEVVSRVKEV